MTKPALPRRHISLSASYAGILSYTALLVKLVEDLALHGRFDATDNTTLITTIAAIAAAAVTLMGGQVLGAPQDAPVELAVAPDPAPGLPEHATPDPATTAAVVTL